MIRAVLDTNIVISGTLWSGKPHFVLQAAVKGQVRLFVSELLLDELKDVLERPKFSKRLIRTGKSAPQVVEDYASLAQVIETENITGVVSADADDDHVLACAVSGQADYIVSGDPHLLELEQYLNIRILTASEFLNLLTDENEPADGL